MGLHWTLLWAFPLESLDTRSGGLESLDTRFGNRRATDEARRVGGPPSGAAFLKGYRML